MKQQTNVRRCLQSQHRLESSSPAASEDYPVKSDGLPNMPRPLELPVPPRKFVLRGRRGSDGAASGSSSLSGFADSGRFSSAFSDRETRLRFVSTSTT